MNNEQNNINDDSLYSKVGGEPAITAVVSEFYDRVLADPALAPYFRHKQRQGLEELQVKFFSQALADQGIDPLPGYTPPAESAASAPELATRFPLQLVSPPSPHFLNSTFANVESLKSAAGEPEIEIHADDAASRGITNGDAVRIHNDRGWFRAKASVGDSVRDGVVVATGIWWNKHVEGGWNANATTPTRLADLGGGSTLFDNLVEVESLES